MGIIRLVAMMTVTCQKSVLSQRAESDTLGMVVYLCSLCS